LKKLLFISLVLIGIASLASATPVTCAVLMSPNTGGGSTSVCTVTADAGFYISSLTLSGTDDYTGYQSGSPTVSFGGTISQTAGLDTPFTNPTFCNVITVGVNSVSCGITVNPTATVTNTNQAITTYSLQLINIVNSVAGGSVTGASIVLNLDYGQTQIPTGGVPEPATLGLMGSALMGLGLLARRKKK
jgi:hypothetical protein